MADQKQLDSLKQGVKVWNEWRAEDLLVQIDLSGDDLSGVDLRDANLFLADLSGANLSEASLYHVDLSGANLSDVALRNADLRSANLSSVNLSGANLSEASCDMANLSGANLSCANLSEASLYRANLTDANLFLANFSKVILWLTVFGAVDLSAVKGLETVYHQGPSTIGIDTIIRSKGKIPEIFLRNAGVPDSIVEAIPSLIGSLSPIDYYSCFVSYLSKDQAFAEWLHSDLRSKGVRCWYAPHDMRIGDEIRPRIDESIRVHDKLLLVLSESSLASTWVKKEVETAFEKEAQQNKLVLFPIRLDDTVLHTPQAWAADIRRMRHIGDFTRWKEHDEYQQAFTRLLKDLQAQ